jgi:hypothetical protein
MMRAACVLLPLLLWGCGPATLPAPSIVSVEPLQVAVGVPSTLSVQVSAVLPLSVDYQGEDVDTAQLAMTVHLAGQQVDIPFAESDGTLIVPVPEGLALGAYDVQVTLADGREALRKGAFFVVPAPTLTGAPPRDHPPEEGRDGITGFLIDPIGEQTRNTPFKVTLRVLGAEAKRFQEPVSLRVNKGKVTSATLGSFTDGVRVEEIALSHPGSNLYLLIEDSWGHKGLSNSFQVRSH